MFCFRYIGFVNDFNTRNKSENKQIFVWTQEATKILICTYESMLGQFKSTSIKNEKVWSKIAEILSDAGIACTAQQCENRLKYLKGRYLKKRDNMSIRSSGADNFKCEFFPELDSIFGKKPNVTPIAEASTSRGCPNVEEYNPDTMKRCAVAEHPEVGFKKTKLQKEVDTWRDEFNKNAKMREEAREKRHQELVMVQKQATEEYQNMMLKLLENL